MFFLLDFKGSTEYSLGSVRITALPTRGSHTVETRTLNVERTHTADSIVQKLCVSSILRDLCATMMSQDQLQLYSEGRSFGLSSLVTSAERLGQMYSVCNRWTSKVAADSICGSDDDVESNGQRLYEDELSRLTLPTHLSPPDRPAMISTAQAGQAQAGGLEAIKESSRKYSKAVYFEVGSNRYENGETSCLKMDQKPSRETQATGAPPNRQNEYFVPRDGIDREVITADIARYLGNDALVRPGTYENKKDGRVMQGYFITAYRNLTSAMIADLKADSARWQQERREYNSGTAQHDARTGQEYAPSQNNTITGYYVGHYVPSPAIGVGSAMSGAVQHQPQAAYQDSGMASTPYPPSYNPTFDRAYAPAYPDASNDQSYCSIGANLGSVDQRQGVYGAQQAPRVMPSHEPQRIWRRIAASRSADGTYALSADLRDRIAACFNPGTREWLFTRIAPSLSDENGALELGAAADAMLVMAFVDIYIASRYEEIEQDIGLVLESGQDQREVLEELVLRVCVHVRSDIRSDRARRT